MPTTNKCESCGQVVMIARVRSMGEWGTARFTARPAPAYVVDGGQAVRYAEDKKLYLYHDAVCPRRQVTPVEGVEAACERCRTSLIWALSPAGHRMPFDARPVVVYIMNDELIVPTMDEYSALAPLLISHFASCPDAGWFSKGRK